MIIPKCLGCKTIEKDSRSKRCFLCRNEFYKTNEWANTSKEIERRRKISINNGKSNLGGKILTEEVRKKIGLTHKGNTYRLGKTLTEEAKRKISEAHKGKRLSKETKRKIGDSHRGEKSHLWKGENVGYRGLHYWVRSLLGTPDTCEFCGKNGLSGRKIHWANKSGEYKHNITDWLRLCVKCHKAYDRNKLAII